MMIGAEDCFVYLERAFQKRLRLGIFILVKIYGCKIIKIRRDIALVRASGFLLYLERAF